MIHSTTHPPIAKNNKASFVIPVLNEENYLPATLDSIDRYHPIGWDYEIIIVDHGSTDRTRDIAIAAGATVLMPNAATIAALRNAGASNAEGAILIFLDADVTLTPEWRAASAAWLVTALENQGFITGSKVLPPPGDSFVIENWFRPLVEQKTNKTRYLGSAHLIVPTSLFNKTGGFDPTLQTGEDYDFCERSRAKGFDIVPNNALRSFHSRFPKNVGEFIRRERWHGCGDRQSWGRVLKSKVAMMTIAFVLLHGIAFASALVASMTGAIVSILLILGLLGVSVLKKFSSNSPKQFLYRIPICYAYYVGRALAFLPSGRWQ